MINNSNNISFCGATRWFKRELFINNSSVDNIINCSKSEFVGELPKEIILDIINTSKNEKIKKNRIKNIMEGFSKISQKLIKTTKELEKIPVYWEPSKEFKNKKLLKIIKKRLNKVFKENKLLRFWQKIEVKTLGEGGFGDVFLIEFPQKKQYPPLALKVFKDTPLNLLNINNHGSFSENNTMIYVTNLFKKAKTPSVFADGYFGSLKNNFLVSQYIPDTFNSIEKDWVYTAAGEKRCEEISKILSDKGLYYDDFRSENIIGGKIIDYGGLEDKKKEYLKKFPDLTNN